MKNDGRIYSNELYDLAAEFRKYKLWEKLLDSEIFGIKHSNGITGYCSVMGHADSTLAIADYIGDEGLDSLRIMYDIGLDMDYFDYEKNGEKFFSQNCIMCCYDNKEYLRDCEIDDMKKYARERKINLRGKRAYTQFLKFLPKHFPWYVQSEADLICLKETLMAGIEVAKRLKDRQPYELGFKEGLQPGKIIPVLEFRGDNFVWSKQMLPDHHAEKIQLFETSNEILIKKVKKAKRKQTTWMLDFFISPEAVAPSGFDENTPEYTQPSPIYPYYLLIVGKGEGNIVSAEIISDIDNYGEEACTKLLGTMSKIGIPRRIMVNDDRIEIMLQKLSSDFGIELKYDTYLDELDEARDSLVEYRNNENKEDELLEMLDAIIDIVRMPGEIKKIPDEILYSFEMFINSDLGMLPPDVEKAIAREIRRREHF